MASLPGIGIAKGMIVTVRHFLQTYVGDIFPSKAYHRHQKEVATQDYDGVGIFTVQYPEERLKLPERFRCLPMLVMDDEAGQLRCTACGICAKVCPPQCIWIERAVGPDGKSKPMPAQYRIDTTLCMSCGFCAEFCPFDAIKMNHQYELAGPDRCEPMLYDISKLTVSEAYYAQTHPKAFAAEAATRRKRPAKS